MASQILAKRLLLMSKLLPQTLVAASGEVEVCAAGLLRFLLKAVQHEDCPSIFCHLEDAERHGVIPDSYFTNAPAYCLHRLPIVRIAVPVALTQVESLLHGARTREKHGASLKHRHRIQQALRCCITWSILNFVWPRNHGFHSSIASSAH